MMAEKIYACAEPASLGALVDGIRAVRPEAVIVPVDDPIKMRVMLLAEIPSQAAAYVGHQGEGIDAVNLAAALVADAHASRVELMCHAPSGSLRSRAARAGIDRVSDIPAPAAADASLPSAGAPPVAAALGASGEAAHAGPEAGMSADAITSEGAGASGEDQGARILRAEDAGKVLVFASGRGGVGKSTIAATAAQAAASWGLAVALLDLDLGSGNLFGYHGLPKAPDLAKLAGASEEEIVGAGAHVADGVELWGPCIRPEHAEEVFGHVGDIINALANAYDLVLVDTSTTWTDAVAEAVQDADRLMLVADERAGAIGSLARMAALAVRLGVARTRIMRVMNRCDARRKDEAFLFRADMGLETARSFRILDGGAEVAEVLSSGSAKELDETSGDFFPSVASCVAKVLSELGCLPDEKAAKKACEWRERRHGLIFRMREAS